MRMVQMAPDGHPTLKRENAGLMVKHLVMARIPFAMFWDGKTSIQFEIDAADEDRFYEADQDVGRELGLVT